MVGVLFNREGRDHARGKRNGYHLPATYKELQKKFDRRRVDTHKRSIDEFPRGTVALKTVWWPIPGTGMTAVPLWEPRPGLDPKMQYWPSTWTDFVIVDPSREHIPIGETGEAWDVNHIWRRGPVVSVWDFYFVKRSEVRVSAVGGADNDLALLVGMHITAKEIPDWVWATFWWHLRPDEPPFGCDRLPEEPGQRECWKNYVMDVAYSIETPPEDEDASPNICFNPWLEASFKYGIKSNCMGCHQRAAMEIRDRRLRRPGFDVERWRLMPDDSYFADKTRTDYLWSLPGYLSGHQ